MSFMQRQIYFGGYFSIDTTVGTEIVPADVIGRTCSTHVQALLDYLEGVPVDKEALVEHETGWLARLSAPGYMDCTSWGAYKTQEEADAALEDMFGEEEG